MFKATLAVLFSICLPLSALAQVPGANDPDIKEIAAYRLTMPTVSKVMQATRNLMEAMKSDARFIKIAAMKAEIKTLEEKEEPTEGDIERIEKMRAEVEQLEDALNPADSNDQTLSGMVAAIGREPAAARALSSAGLTAREYAKFMVAYLQAGMVAGMMKQGLIKEVPKDLAATMNMENVTFFRDHQAELEAFQKEMDALKMQ